MKTLVLISLNDIMDNSIYKHDQNKCLLNINVEKSQTFLNLTTHWLKSCIPKALSLFES